MQHTRFGSSSHLSHPPTGFCVPYRRIGGAPGHTIPRWRSPSELGIVCLKPPRSLGMVRRNPFSHTEGSGDPLHIQSSAAGTRNSAPKARPLVCFLLQLSAGCV